MGLGLSAFIPQTLKLLENPHSSGALKPLQPARGNLVPCVGPEQEGSDLRDLCRACCAWRTACPTLLAHPRQTRFLQLPSGGVIPECSREHIIIHRLARLGALFIENKTHLMLKMLCKGEAGDGQSTLPLLDKLPFSSTSLLQQALNTRGAAALSVLGRRRRSFSEHPALRASLPGLL